MRGSHVNCGELLATCVASALATLVLSRLGVAGTILGAAVTPAIITLAEAVTDEPISDWGRDGGSGSRSGDQAPAHESATLPDGRGPAAQPSPTPAASVRTPSPAAVP